jgi:putative tricarboxylic transport membrane protein
MIISYIVMLFTIIPLTRYLSRVTLISTMYLVPVIVCFTLVGAFAPRAYLFDMGLAMAFGILGFIARKTGYHVVGILIGVILGPMIEQYFLRALRLSDGDLTVFFTSTVGNFLWALLFVSLAAPFFIGRFRKAKA